MKRVLFSAFRCSMMPVKQPKYKRNSVTVGSTTLFWNRALRLLKGRTLALVPGVSLPPGVMDIEELSLHHLLITPSCLAHVAHSCHGAAAV